MGSEMTKREGGGSLPADLGAQLHDIVEAARAGFEDEDLDPIDDVFADEPQDPGLDVDLVQACELLDPYTRHAEAGASDAWLAAQTQLALSVIISWRRHRGISRRSYEREHGLSRRRLGALDLFRDDRPEDFGIQPAEASPVLGQWRPPDIMLRQTLDYDLLAQYLHFLAAEAPATPVQLAQAFGFRVHDVEMAIELWRRRITEHGELCKTCGTPCVGKYCSARCRRKK